MDKEVVIIGAGVSGLCTGHYLVQALGKRSLVMLEAGPGPGGTTGSDIVNGYILDWGSNGFLNREPLTLSWAEDLGLAPYTIKANTAAAKRFIPGRETAPGSNATRFLPVAPVVGQRPVTPLL